MNMVNFNRIFKNMPRGTTLYSPLIGDCTLERVDTDNNIIVSFVDEHDNKRYPAFNGDFGFLKDCCRGKVMIFPNKNETWENWQIALFKKGDFVTCGCGCVEIYLTPTTCINANGKVVEISVLKNYTYASDREISDFKGALRLNGFKWNSVNKELEHVVEKPKFKVGERIKYIGNDSIAATITEITDTTYILEDNSFIYIYEQEHYSHVCYMPIYRPGDFIKKKGTNLHGIIESVTDRCYTFKNDPNEIVLFEFQYDWEIVYGDGESYCNYENCKKLVEYGFKYKGDLADNLEKHGFYSGPNHNVVFDDYVVNDEDCIRISQNSAMKWLRKVYGIEIGAKPLMDCDLNTTVYIPFVKRYDSSRKEYVNEISYLEAIACDDYEEAIDSAITHTFKKLI